MAKKTIIGLLLILLIAGVGMWIYSGRSDGSFDVQPDNALGAGVAEETAKLLGDHGQVTIIMPDSELNSGVESALRVFRETLKSHGITVAAVLRFKQNLIGLTSGGMVPRNQLITAIQSHPEIDAIVLFCGMPELTPQEYNTLKQGGVKIVVVSGYFPFYANLLKSRVIDMAVVPRFGHVEAVRKPQTLRKFFESEFMVLTPGNISQLPEWVQ